MLSTELRARQSKLESEQRNRIQKEIQKKEKERLLQERVRQRQLQRDEEARLKRLSEQAAQQKVRRPTKLVCHAPRPGHGLHGFEPTPVLQELEQQQELIEHNRGVYYKAILQAVTVSDDVAVAKGIRRAADKVLLPPSASRTLLDQDASKNGAMLFHLSTPFGTQTCAGNACTRAQQRGGPRQSAGNVHRPLVLGAAQLRRGHCCGLCCRHVWAPVHGASTAYHQAPCQSRSQPAARHLMRNAAGCKSSSCIWPNTDEMRNSTELTRVVLIGCRGAGFLSAGGDCGPAQQGSQELVWPARGAQGHCGGTGHTHRCVHCLLRFPALWKLYLLLVL
jgi:hypothetical protein